MPLPRAQRRVGRGILLHELKQRPFHVGSPWPRLPTSSWHSHAQSGSDGVNVRQPLNVADRCTTKPAALTFTPCQPFAGGPLSLARGGQTCTFGRSLSSRTTISLLRTLRQQWRTTGSR